MRRSRRFLLSWLFPMAISLVGCGINTVPEQEAIDQVKAADAREMEEFGSLDRD